MGERTPTAGAGACCFSWLVCSDKQASCIARQPLFKHNHQHIGDRTKEQHIMHAARTLTNRARASRFTSQASGAAVAVSIAHCQRTCSPYCIEQRRRRPHLHWRWCTHTVAAHTAVTPADTVGRLWHALLGCKCQFTPPRGCCLPPQGSAANTSQLARAQPATRPRLPATCRATWTAAWAAMPPPSALRGGPCPVFKTPSPSLGPRDTL